MTEKGHSFYEELLGSLLTAHILDLYDIHAHCNIVTCVLKGKSHIAAAAKDMNNMPRITQVIEILQSVGKNNSVEVRLFHNRFSFVSKITENHE